MIIIEDTRQQEGQHNNIAAYCEAHGIELIRSKLLVGDYTLPADQSVCIDTKKDLGEVYGNLIQDHKRFKDECLLAHKCGIQLIVLVENTDGITTIEEVADWKNPRYDAYLERLAYSVGKARHGKAAKHPAEPVSSQRISRIMETMSERYGVMWMFCDPKDTGQKIIELLERKNNEWLL